MPSAITIRPTCAVDEPLLYRVFCTAQEYQYASLELTLDQREQLMTMQFEAQQHQY